MSALGTARAFGVMLGGSVVLVGAAATSAVSAVHRLFSGRLPRPWSVAGVALTAIYFRFVRPWHLRWGTESDEDSVPLPGDEFLPEAGTDLIHGVTIDAPAEAVWPWLAQIGQDRGGMYSYEWLENLAGCEMRNAETIHPEWQHREIGEVVYLHPSGGLEVTVFEPGRAIGLRNWGTMVLVPQGATRTRLLVRGRIPRGLFAAGYAMLMEIPHFVMERRMLVGIKERAERAYKDRDHAR
jgi:hypothetical protein